MTRDEHLPTLLAIASAFVLTPGAVASAKPASSQAAMIRAIEADIEPLLLVKGQAVKPITVEEEMARRHTPALSIAVADGGRIIWTRTYGYADVATHRKPDVHTVFQAASISKPVAASAAMQLVQEGKLALDAPINTELKSWRLPDSPFTRDAPVTLRGLLTHTAGMTVHGFPGYAADAAVPSVVQVIEGKPPANTAAVVVERKPGAAWSYSGGGITIAQLAMTDVTGEAFPALMKARVLGPVGMTDSTYEQPLPEDRRGDAAHAYLDDGTAVKGDFHTYPEMAAAGLWTTPTDLVKWALALGDAYEGRPSPLMSQASARTMLTPGLGDWGIGIEVKGEGEARRFMHSGGNWGFRSFLVGWTHGGRAIAVMVNGDDSFPLAMKMTQAVARRYGWKGMEAKTVEAVDLAPADLAALAGRYGGGTAILTLSGKTLVATSQGQAVALIATGPDHFVRESDGLDIEVERGPDGKPTALKVAGETLRRD